MGLTSIQVFDGNYQRIHIPATSISASPKDINDLPGHSGDYRTLDKLVDGHNVTANDQHMWLIPFSPPKEHQLTIDLGAPLPLPPAVMDINGEIHLRLRLKTHYHFDRSGAYKLVKVDPTMPPSTLMNNASDQWDHKEKLYFENDVMYLTSTRSLLSYGVQPNSIIESVSNPLITAFLYQQKARIERDYAHDIISKSNRMIDVDVSISHTNHVKTHVGEDFLRLKTQLRPSTIGPMYEQLNDYLAFDKHQDDPVGHYILRTSNRLPVASAAITANAPTTTTTLGTQHLNWIQ
eukprot:gene7886-9257_t